MNDPASLVAPEPETATEPDSQARPVDATAWLSWLRFIAIVGVVSIHTAGYTAAAAGARDRLEGQLAIALDIGAIFTVPLFVMISGALLLDPKKFHGTEDFLRRLVCSHEVGETVPLVDR